MYKLNKTYKIITLFSWYLLFVLSPLAHANDNKPDLNVILLTADTFRPDHLGFSGYHRDTTPFLDSIAKKGVVFENTIGSASWTSPGLISIITGLYPHVHGVDARSRSLLPNTNTLFKVFKENGYRVPNLSYLTVIPNFSGLGMETPENANRGSNNGLYENELVSWLKQYSKQGKERGQKDKKYSNFMTWYHYRKLHLPYTSSLIEDKSVSSPAIKKIKKQSVIPYKTVEFSDADRKKTNELYDNQLADFDAFVKNIYEELVRLKLDKNTLIVISADHGEELFEHGFVGHASTMIHATMYDEVIKVPLVFHLPSRLKQGVTVKKQVRQIDIMPTILDIAGLPIPNSIQGVSLLPVINGKDTFDDVAVDRPSEKYAISEAVIGGYQTPIEDQYKKIYAIRSTEWKLIKEIIEGKERYQLYDLKSDPKEKVNLVDKKPEKVSELKKQLEDAYRKMELKRLTMLSQNKTDFKAADIPKNSKLEIPQIKSPKAGEVIKMGNAGVIKLQWTGDQKSQYLVEYDIGKGFRNIKGKMVVHGTERVFGPFPEEIYSPLPAWNPFKIRVSPYGVEKYQSEWVEFEIKVDE